MLAPRFSLTGRYVLSPLPNATCVTDAVHAMHSGVPRFSFAALKRDTLILWLFYFVHMESRICARGSSCMRFTSVKSIRISAISFFFIPPLSVLRTSELGISILFWKFVFISVQSQRNSLRWLIEIPLVLDDSNSVSGSA